VAADLGAQMRESAPYTEWLVGTAMSSIMSNMSARRQHTLPQFLLAGFVSRGRRFTWLFRKGRDPVETNVTNVAVGRDFYGKVQDTGIETLLSRRESDYAAFLKDAINRGGVPSDARAVAAGFVTNLMLRSSHLRAAFSDAHDSLITLLDSDEIAESFLRLFFKVAPRHTRKILGLRASDPIPEDVRWIVERLSKADIKLVVKHFLEGLRSIPREEIVFDAQTRTLLHNPEPRVRLYADLHWTLHEERSATFILGDVGPVATFDGGEHFLLPIKDNRVPDMICIPVSREYLLVGAKATGQAPPGTEQINQSIAELSAMFFVAALNTSAERSYHGAIGKRFHLLEFSEMAELAEQAFKELAEEEDW